MSTVETIESIYLLTPSCKKVLNTIKLHAQQFFGVCWLKAAEIAAKAGVSLSSVFRSIKELREAGLLTVHNWTHTVRGGDAHNIYVINPIEQAIETPSDMPSDIPNDTPVEGQSALEPQAIERSQLGHRNLDTNPYMNPDNNLNSKKEISSNLRKDEPTISEDVERELTEQQLAGVPQEFVNIFKPFYADQPEIILARWKTACVAMRKNCFTWANTSWETVRYAWLETVRRYKAGKIKQSDNDGLGGYFYKAVSEHMSWDYVDAIKEQTVPERPAGAATDTLERLLDDPATFTPVYTSEPFYASL
ncbi:helix-turn-helix domain-containing protein [Paenibacillus peoriae]|nr:helix-turn-helix domain-containing protein [Paenibacillus peoriae]